MEISYFFRVYQFRIKILIITLIWAAEAHFVILTVMIVCMPARESIIRANLNIAKIVLV